ncbi:MAG: prepilin-type N-terminal cleavage/methylation domain-containing protein [Candidatus Riflebacteria bacterium]
MSYSLRKNIGLRGFSLVEIMIGAGILALILGIGYKMNVSRNQKNLTGKLVLQMDALMISNRLMFELRRCSDFVRPHLGETSTYLLARDMTNQMLFIYLEEDKDSSEKFDGQLFKLKMYRDSHSGSYQKKEEHVLARAVKRMTFTCLDPNTVQLNLILSNEREDFQCITKVSSLNLGDLE